MEKEKEVQVDPQRKKEELLIVFKTIPNTTSNHMIIAQEKKEQNIVEYILYMWQVEDIIRASKFNLTLINEHIIEKYKQPDSVKKDILDWYENHIEMMVNEGKQKTGHLIYLENILGELYDLHNKLLHQKSDNNYQGLFGKALPVISELKTKSGGNKMNELEICFNGLYGYLMLKISGQTVTEQTTQAIKNLSNMLAYLADRYKRIEQGKEEV